MTFLKSQMCIPRFSLNPCFSKRSRTQLEAGGKPSTWFPPGFMRKTSHFFKLVELYFFLCEKRVAFLKYMRTRIESAREDADEIELQLLFRHLPEIILT